MSSFEGIHTILYAMFGRDGRLDRTAMRLQVEACVAGGAQGVAVLGLATEVSKLSVEERRAVVEWAAEDLRGRLPLAVTIFGATAEVQIEALRHAEGAGAGWAVLQPPAEQGMGEEGLMDLFGRVIEAARVPIGLQNARGLMGVGLSVPGLGEMARRHANLAVLKAEGPATEVQEVVEATRGRVAVLNGRGGLELPDCFRAGAVGMIPAPDCFDVLTQAWGHMRAGDEAGGERSYGLALPVIAFAMQGVDHLVCYGKRVVAGRLGLGEVFDRGPGVVPSAFGLEAVKRFVARLGPYPELSG